MGAHLVPTLGVCANLRVTGPRDAKIQAIAAVQHGRVSRAQLHAAAISNDAIARCVAQGRLVPLAGGVFAVDAGHSALADEAAALLAVGFEAAVSHLSAAALWDMVPAAQGPVDVLAPPGARSDLEHVRVHRTRCRAAQDLQLRRGLPVTSPARTLLDIAGRLTPRRLELAFDRALVSRILHRDAVAELLARTRGRAEGPRLRALLEREHGITVTRSEAEEGFMAAIRGAGLPHPELNARIHGFEVDFMWRTQGVVVEIDGFRFHSTRRAFEHDHRKDVALRAAGLLVLRFTPVQVQTETLAVVVDVTRALYRGRD